MIAASDSAAVAAGHPASESPAVPGALAGSAGGRRGPGPARPGQADRVCSDSLTVTDRDGPRLGPGPGRPGLR
jgi:hypothetical protein